MTYLGKASLTRNDKMAVEERVSITEQGYTVDKLLDGTECQILGLVNHLVLNPTIYIVDHSTHYPSLHLRHREFK